MTELKSNAEWIQWGKDDPLWGVASWADKQKDGSSPWTKEEFYALGESDWRDFLSHWQQYGVKPQSCLEIGCGAGRLTRQLALSFGHVFAVDVSPQMIGLAEKAVESAKVEFSVIDGLHLPQCDGSVDAVFSTHVLQHLDNEEIGRAYFGELFRVLKVGGTIMVHLPLYQFPNDQGTFGTVMRSQFGAFRFLANMKASINRSRGAKIMRGTQYSIKGLNRCLSETGYKNIEFRIFSVRSNKDPHPFVFATK